MHEKEIDTINLFWTTRNDLDHNRSWDSELNENDAHTLSEAVTDWYDSIFCKKCGEYIYEKTEVWRCSCDELRYKKKV